MATAYKAVKGDYGSVWKRSWGRLLYHVGTEVSPAPASPGVYAVDTIEEARAWVKACGSSRRGARVVELEYNDPGDVIHRRATRMTELKLSRCTVVAEHPPG